MNDYANEYMDSALAADHDSTNETTTGGISDDPGERTVMDDSVIGYMDSALKADDGSSNEDIIGGISENPKERTVMENNVHGRIDDYLDQVFTGYDDSPAVSELRIEIRHDLLERLNDLTNHGIGDEVAYAKVISSIGDIDAIITELLERESDYVLDAGAIGGQAAGEQAVEEHDDGEGVGEHDGEKTADQPALEPDGPADAIPDGDAPGAHWQGATSADEASSETPTEDWISGVAQAVAAGLEAARTQISWALGQAEEALNRAGLLTETEPNDAQPFDTATARAWTAPKMTFASTDLKDADFSGQNLAQSNFAAASMREVRFCSAILTGSSFNGADLRKANFSQADLSIAKMNACSLRNANFERANLTEAGISTSDMRDACFVGADLTKAKARFSDLRDACFTDCRMDGADFTGSDLRRACFDGLSLSGVKFNMANLNETSFRGSVLHYVSFHHVSRGTIARIVFEDTVVDQATYISLRTSGYTPKGVRVES